MQLMLTLANITKHSYNSLYALSQNTINHLSVCICTNLQYKKHIRAALLSPSPPHAPAITQVLPAVWLSLLLRARQQGDSPSSSQWHPITLRGKGWVYI